MIYSMYVSLKISACSYEWSTQIKHGRRMWSGMQLVLEVHASKKNYCMLSILCLLLRDCKECV